MVDESILRKIHKAFELADGNANENERETALAIATNLVKKHNLDMSMVRNFHMDKPIIEDIDLVAEPWVRIIMEALCIRCYTKPLVRRRRNKNTCVVVGMKENVEITLLMADWLIPLIRKEASKSYKDAAHRRSFCIGAGMRLVEKAKQMLAEERRGDGSTTGYSLVLVRSSLEERNEKFLEEQVQVTNSRKPRSMGVHEKALRAGAEAADKIRLDKPERKVNGIGRDK